ncbi:IMPACT family protein [Gulosibacter massiliensis]|uniref:IMPACT family protein n=1 Tax=Gulosibacter massiliensis TaxID=2479839 RepID=UPI000F633051|nr:YigZ family protein [Gulosibacter massiliensis]
MADDSRYGVLAASAEHELEIKRSRFLGYAERVSTESEARDYIELVRAEHRLARHHCTAFTLGPERRIQRSNDDGEPSGTAGVPMLDALTKFVRPGAPSPDLSDIIIVVVRYFGGVLLGAGGLVRAYSDTVSQTLASAKFLTRERLARYAVDAPIAQVGRWENELRAAGVEVLGTDYGPASATLRLAVPDQQDAREQFLTRLASITSGEASPTELEPSWVDVSRR